MASEATENVNRFLERLSNDTGFRAEYKMLPAGNISALMDFALTKGYVFTEPDLKKALANYPSNPTIDQLRDQLKVSKGTAPA